MNLAALNEALGEMCDARKAWRMAWRAYEDANIAKRAADARWQKSKTALNAQIDLMIEAHK